jgi:hypothetical protein
MWSVFTIPCWFDGRALDDRQDVALHAFAADVGTVRALAARDLVDLVDEDDAGLLHALDRGARDGVHVHELVLFLLRQRLERVRHGELALARPALEEAGQHVLDVDVHFLDRGTGDDLEGRKALLAHVDLDLLLVEAAVAQLLAQLFARAVRLLATRAARVSDRGGGGAAGRASAPRPPASPCRAPRLPALRGPS